MNSTLYNAFASRLTTRNRVWLVVGFAIALIHAPLLTKPFVDSDEAVYASIAALSNDVGRLYAEGGVDNKFPGIFWIYAGVFRLFGRYAMNAVHVLTIVFVLATAAALGAIAVRAGGRSAAWVAALFYGIATTLYTPKMLGANTEVFAMLPVSVAVLLAVPDDSSPRPGLPAMYAAGALIGAATVIRQLAGLNLFLICAVPLFWQGATWPKRLAASIVAGLGCATVAGLLVYSFVADGTLRDFWFWTVSVVRQRYLPAGWHPYVPLHQLAMLAETVVFWTLIVLRARRWRRLSFAEKAIWGWLLVSVAIVVVPGRFHPHYAIQAFAPLAIVSAMEFRQRLDEASEPKHWRLIGWSTGLLTALAVVFGVIAVVWEPFAPTHFGRKPPIYLEVARYVRKTTATNDRIFVWGAYTPIYVIADRLPASRFVAFKRGCARDARSPFADCWDSGPEMWPLLERDLAANPPTLIVDTAPADLGDFGVYPIESFAVFRELLARSYSRETTINGVVIYRRVPSRLGFRSCEQSGIEAGAPELCRRAEVAALDGLAARREASAIFVPGR